MHNIVYQNGVIESELIQIVDVHKPFHSRVDKVKRKASLSKLIISPDDTRASPQIKRFLVPVGARYAYKMHVTYKGDLKCHNIYDTNSSVDRILRSSMIKTVMDNIDDYPFLKRDLTNITRKVVESWDFDCVITDIPFLVNQYNVPVFHKEWNLLNYEGSIDSVESVSLFLKKYGSIPLNLLPYSVIKNVRMDWTDIEDIPYTCPLYIMQSNSYYSGYLANLFNKGLPTTLFKVVGKVY